MTAVMIAFTYPGQGSQTPGMGEPWTDHPSWRMVDEASEASGRDVAHLLLRADSEELRHTRNSQLSTFVLSMVVLDAVERTGVAPACHAGHSLGEYSALTAAGVLTYRAGVQLVTERGDAMQAAAEATRGTMAAVLGLDDEKVELACRRADGEVWVANYNSAGQVVIAGDADGITKAAEIAKQLGAKRVMPIKVGGAFHTPFMAPARDRLHRALAETDLRNPTRPVFANVDAEPHTRSTEWAGLLGAQLTSPVLWRQILHSIDAAGTTVFLELGPGTTLTGLVRRTLRGRTALSVATPADVDTLLENLSHAGETGTVAEGERLYAVERLIVSPTTGVFQPYTDIRTGQDIVRGQPVGVVGNSEVRSAFDGSLQGLLALRGERVTISQPVAWLRIPSLGKP